jgi:AbrB family looped-hinge helix DNA binding protein
MGEQVKVLQKGKITIPADMRQKLGITEGDFITIEMVNNKVVISPPNTVPNPTEFLIGLAEGIKVEEPLKQEVKKAVASRITRKLQRANP